MASAAKAGKGTGIDILRLPLIGRLLRWRRGRLAMQLLLLAAAALMVYDGLSGPQLAPQNLAGVVTWVQYRGLLMLSLLLCGNLFCMACPFALLRSLGGRFVERGRRWPKRLRSKWVAMAVLILFFFLYEWLDLWASPWMTAWLILIYFAAAFILEAAFSGSPFCKYVCPMGSFNFAGSMISPTQIGVGDRDTCVSCQGKPCINGDGRTLGCGTSLFPPQISSNMDCVLCLDCARACPHDNVVWRVRNPLAELSQPARWPRRWDASLLLALIAFAGVSNAFGMVPPFYRLEEWLWGVTGIRSEGLLLGLIFGALNVAVPLVLILAAAWGSRRLSGADMSLRANVSGYAPALVPVSFAIWLAHYGFHFASGALGIIPVTQFFLNDHGISWLGAAPRWDMGQLMPMAYMLPIQLLIVLTGVWASNKVIDRAALPAGVSHRGRLAAGLPWLALVLLLAAAAMVIFTLPMEMRGAFPAAELRALPEEVHPGQMMSMLSAPWVYPPLGWPK